MLGKLQNNVRLQLLLLLSLGVICYANTLNHSFILDDVSVIQENQFVNLGFSGIPSIWKNSYLYGYTQSPDESYRPLPLTVFAILYGLVGDNPFPFHAAQVLIYILLLGLLFSYLKVLLHKQHPLIPFVVVALFAVHPVHTEVIANVKSLDELLALVCGVIALRFHFKYLNTSSTKDLLLSLSGFLGAMLSKEVGVTFILLFPLQNWLFTEQSLGKVIKKNTIYILPFFGYFLMRFTLLENMTFQDGTFKLDVYNNGLLAAEGITEYIATAFTILLHYLKLLILPHPLSYDYSYEAFPIVGLDSPLALLGIFLYVALFVWGIQASIKRQPLAFALFFFLVTLSIYTNLVVKIGSTAADRFLFTPSLGAILIAILAIESLTNTEKIKILKPAFLGAISLAVLILFTGLTISRNGDWQSEEKLFLTDVETVPQSFRAHLFAASVYSNKVLNGEPSTSSRNLTNKAIRHLKQAYKIYPGFEDTYVQLAQEYRTLGEWKNMQASANAGLKVFPENYSLQFLLGEAYMNDGKDKLAAKQFKALLSSSDSAHQFSSAYNMGAMALNSGNFKEAEKYFTLSYKHGDKDENSAYYLAMAKFQLEDYGGCISYFGEISPSNPAYAHSQSSIGTCYLVMEEYEKSIDYFKNALIYAPGDANILNNMAVAYQEMGMQEKADECMAQINQTPGSGAL